MTQDNPRANNQSPAEGLRQKLIDYIHRPVAWAKVGRHDDVYLMDVEKTDHLAEDMANYAMQIVTAYAATVEREARIDEIKRPMTLHVELMSSADFKAGFSEALDQIDKADELRVAALQGPIQGDAPDQSETA